MKNWSGNIRPGSTINCIWFSFLPGAPSDELIGKGIDPKKICLFPRGVDTVRFHPSKRNVKFLKERFNAGDGPKILYVGRISKEKDLHVLAQAFRSLTQTIEDVELILVGDGPYLKELKELLAGTPCIFTGYRDGEELVDNLCKLRSLCISKRNRHIRQRGAGGAGVRTCPSSLRIPEGRRKI